MDTIQTPSLKQIAEHYPLWETYVDPDGHHSEDDFEAMTLEERFEFLMACGFQDDDQ
jgi:hypothetical protein